jgi:hypothetical protein
LYYTKLQGERAVNSLALRLVALAVPGMQANAVGLGFMFLDMQAFL